MPARIRSSIVVAGILAGVALAAAQQGPLFRSKVDLVRLDVSVIDKDRRPVRGLAAADFSVFEDSQPQTIVAFSPVEVADPPPVPIVNGMPITWMRDVAPDVQNNNAAIDTPQSRLFVMLLDDAMLPNDAWMIQNAKKAARSVIEKLAPTDRLAIVFSSDSSGAQDFTTDKARLLSRLDKLNPGRAQYYFGWDTIESKFSHDCHPNAPLARLSDGDIGARDGSFNTLRGVAEALMASPERRKALIYIGPGIPINPADAGVAPMGNPTDSRQGNAPTLLSERSTCAVPTPAPRESAVIHESNQNLYASLTTLFRRMRLADVVMYPIDPSGLDGMASYIARVYSGLSTVAPYQKLPVDPITGRPSGPAVPLPRDLGAFQGKLSLDFLLTTAENTGGHAVVNTNDVELGVQRIFEENSSFYLLGYQPPADNPPGSEHRLTVKVNRPGVTVNVRSGYITAKPEKVDPKHPGPSPLSKAVADLLPRADVPLRVALAAIKRIAPALEKGKKDKTPADTATVAVILGLERAVVPKPILDGIQIQISAFTEDGVARGSNEQIATVAIRPSASGDVAHYEALSHIDLRPGRYRLRLAAYSAVSDAIGSVFADVDVPNFSSDPVSLSGILLESHPPVPSAPRETFAALLPIVPTAERAFQRLDLPATFVRVYQGGDAALRPVTLTTRIVNERGEQVLDRTETIAPDRFATATRATDVRTELPIRTLPRGEFLLTYTVSSGSATASRPLRFTVR